MSGQKSSTKDTSTCSFSSWCFDFKFYQFIIYQLFMKKTNSYLPPGADIVQQVEEVLLSLGARGASKREELGVGEPQRLQP